MSSAAPLLAAPLVPLRKTRGFVLTPLADVMFQLLLFFMLTSSLAPYALLPLATGQGGASDAQGRVAQPVPDTPRPADTVQAVWHLGRNEVRSGQVRITLDALPQALDRLQADGIRDLVVLVTQTAQTADLVFLMEAVRRTSIDRLQLVGG